MYQCLNNLAKNKEQSGTIRGPSKYYHLRQMAWGFVVKARHRLWIVSVDVRPLLRGLSPPYGMAYHQSRLSAKEKAEIEWVLMGH